MISLSLWGAINKLGIFNLLCNTQLTLRFDTVAWSLIQTIQFIGNNNELNKRGRVAQRFFVRVILCLYNLIELNDIGVSRGTLATN